MPVFTEVSGWNTNELRSEGGVSDSNEHEITIQNGLGFCSMLLNVTNIDNVEKFTLLHRPIVTSTAFEMPRLLPAFIDLSTESGGIPNFAIAKDLTSIGADPDLELHKTYYVFFVQPNVPYSVPLLEDPSAGAQAASCFDRSCSTKDHGVP